MRRHYSNHTLYHVAKDFVVGTQQTSRLDRSKKKIEGWQFSQELATAFFPESEDEDERILATANIWSQSKDEWRAFLTLEVGTRKILVSVIVWWGSEDGHVLEAEFQSQFWNCVRGFATKAKNWAPHLQPQVAIIKKKNKRERRFSTQ